MAEKGIIFDISHYMLEDGPGIRTNVFVKGCPLRCKWCSNAYGLKKNPQISYNPLKCIGCGACVQVCPVQAISWNTGHDAAVQDFEKCRDCMACVKVCPTKTRKEIGREVFAAEAAKEAEKDQMYYRRSGGGTTVSGGEILMQPQFVTELLKICYHDGIDTAIETSACGNWEDLSEMIAYSDTVFIDCKAIDAGLHKELTGVDNAGILNNIRKAAALCREKNKTIVIRFPCVPTLNDSEKDLAALADFIRELDGPPLLNVLPYHNYGENKYAFIGREYGTKDIPAMTKEDLDRVRSVLDRQGIRYSVGGYNI
ncbi:MAG: glycyl-radical enzyme activating protein [Eubacterium sp.]|nr:glycyl-radical enzyme activating protein [Eubacterium sp.]